VMVQVGDSEIPKWVWRFDVFVTSLAHEPFGPIGTIDVDEMSGAIVDGEQTKAKLYARGRAS
jgi:hypothetical protein